MRSNGDVYAVAPKDEQQQDPLLVLPMIEMPLSLHEALEETFLDVHDLRYECCGKRSADLMAP